MTRTLALASLAAFFSSASPAASLAAFHFDTPFSSVSDPNAPVVAYHAPCVAINTSACGFYVGDSGNPGGSIYYFFGPAGTLEGQILDEAYLSFFIAPNPGYQLNFDSLAFDIAIDNSLATGTTFSIAAEFAYMLTGSSTPGPGTLVVAGSTVTTSNAGTQGPFVHILGDLTGPAYQQITEPLEFRFYGVHDAPFSLDNIELTGSVTPLATPEPATIVTAPALLFLVACRVRIRRAGTHIRQWEWFHRR